MSASGGKKKDGLWKVVMVMLIGLMLVAVPYVNRKSSASVLEQCRIKCKKVDRQGRLAPTIKNPVKTGAYAGPWNCECY